MLQWECARAGGFPIKGMRKIGREIMEIKAEEFTQLKGVRLIDIRTRTEREYGALPDAIVASPEELLARPPADREAKYVVVGRRCDESLRCAQALTSLGYDAASLVGGYDSWSLQQIRLQTPELICERAERSLHRRFGKSIWSRFTRAIKEYRMIGEGDRIAVCISGGKDSFLLAKLFQELQKHSDFPFGLEFIVMDPGYSAENREAIERNAENLKIPVRIFRSDIFDNVYQIEKSPCYLCARMRRGHLYHYAQALGCNKIALGHHYDDVIETILMGMLYGAQIQTMMPKLHSLNFEGMELIRPLYLVREADIRRWRDENELRFIQCACRFTEQSAAGGKEALSKRLEIKRLIQSMKKTNPDVETHIFRSVENVNLSTVIAYKDEDGLHHFLDGYDGKK